MQNSEQTGDLERDLLKQSQPPPADEPVVHGPSVCRHPPLRLLPGFERSRSDRLNEKRGAEKAENQSSCLAKKPAMELMRAHLPRQARRPLPPSRLTGALPRQARSLHLRPDRLLPGFQVYVMQSRPTHGTARASEFRPDFGGHVLSLGANSGYCSGVLERL